MDPNTNSSTNQKSQFEQPTQWQKGTGKREERKEQGKKEDPKTCWSIVVLRVVTKKRGFSDKAACDHHEEGTKKSFDAAPIE